MQVFLIQKIPHLTVIAFGVLALSYCSGMSGSPGGTAGGGAVGEAPGGGAITSGGSGTGSAPLPVSAPAAAASGGGVLSSPADDDLLEGCDPKAFLFLGKDLKKMFEGDFEAGLPWHQIADKPFIGNFGIMAMGGVNVSGMQVRALRISPDKGKVSYRDYTLNQTSPGQHPFTVEFEAPAAGERLELFYYPLEKIMNDNPEIPECVPVKTKDFAESWVSLSAADFAAGPGKRWKIPLGAFNIELYYRFERPDLPDFEFSK
ncbi:MAG: hypothetical protein IT572_04595 [Deltaproteobacteria bacterium]|nr:hypothetical protein [Deltaproteobacteria bacterium]